MESKRYWGVVLAALVCVVTFFVNNEVITPDIMESRNIITAREMVSDGCWIVPTMNGELRLEKPPLPTWLTAVTEYVSPDSLALQRGMAGLAALLLVCFFWKFARRVLKIDPLVPTLLLCTCYNIILMGRTASWDIYCHAFMMGGIYFLAVGLLEERRKWWNFLWAGIFTGLSIMSKGPVSLYALFLPFLISFIYVYRPSARGKVSAIVVMSLLALMIGAWWYAYVHIAEADALGAVVQKESGAWLNHNVRPWWYYWKFFLETGVWSVLLLTAIFLPLFSAERRKSRAWLFSLIWMLASLVLLSLLPEKKSRYLLPLLMPAAYVMGCLMIWWREAFAPGGKPRKGDVAMFRINAILVTVALVALPVAGWISLVKPGYVSLLFWVIFTVANAALIAWMIMATIKLRPMGLLWCVTVLFVAAEAFVMPSLGNIINNPGRRSIEETQKIPELKGLQFYHLDTDTMRIEMVYAAHRTIRPIAADSIAGKLPCVVITHDAPDVELPAIAADSTIVMTKYGVFDDNRRPRTNRRYSPEFIYNVTLLEKR